MVPWPRQCLSQREPSRVMGSPPETAADEWLSPGQACQGEGPWRERRGRLVRSEQWSRAGDVPSQESVQLFVLIPAISAPPEARVQSKG